MLPYCAVVKGPGKLTMTFAPADGSAPKTYEVYEFKGPVSAASSVCGL